LRRVARARVLARAVNALVALARAAIYSILVGAMVFYLAWISNLVTINN
jgi:hypothetical protein